MQSKKNEGHNRGTERHAERMEMKIQRKSGNYYGKDVELCVTTYFMIAVQFQFACFETVSLEKFRFRKHMQIHTSFMRDHSFFKSDSLQNECSYHSCFSLLWFHHACIGALFFGGSVAHYHRIISDSLSVISIASYSIIGSSILPIPTSQFIFHPHTSFCAFF